MSFTSSFEIFKFPLGGFYSILPALGPYLSKSTIACEMWALYRRDPVDSEHKKYR